VLIRDFEKIETAKQLCATRRMDFWETLAKRVGLHSMILRQCMRFAKKYDTSDVNRLIRQGVTWTHVVHLLSLRSEQEREDFLKRVAEEGLTAAALQKEIAKKHGNRREGSGKQRKLPDPPKSLKTGLKRALDKVTRLNDEHEHALFCNEFDLAEGIENVTSDDIDEKIRDQVDRLIESYEQLATTAPKIIVWLREARPRIDLVFEARKQAEKEPEPTSDAAPDAMPNREHRPIMLAQAVTAGVD
jgi:hypothetical protein